MFYYKPLSLLPHGAHIFQESGLKQESVLLPSGAALRFVRSWAEANLQSHSWEPSHSLHMHDLPF